MGDPEARTLGDPEARTLGDEAESAKFRGMNSAEARVSVQALIDDLRYIMGTRPHTGWPAMAEAALEHHRPMIADELLEPAMRDLQQAGHKALEGLVVSDAEVIRAAITEIRRVETGQTA